MRLVEEEYDLGPLHIPHLRQLLEELGQQPHEEGGEDGPLGLDVLQFQGADDAAPIRGHAHEVGNVKGRFTEETVPAAVLQGRDLQCVRNVNIYALK